MNRRRFFYGAALGLAGLAGAGVALRKSSPDSFFGLSFIDVAGNPMAMGQFLGKPLLLNFWATWCTPCVTELPLINRFYLENKAKGWQVLGLAIDRPETVQNFLTLRPLNFPVVLSSGMQGFELSKALGNSASGIPFSVAFDPTGQISQRRIGSLTSEDLSNWAQLL